MGKQRRSVSTKRIGEDSTNTSDAPKNRLAPKTSWFEPPSKETLNFVLQSAGKGAFVQTFLFLVMLAVGQFTLAVAEVNAGLYLFFIHEGMQLNLNMKTLIGKPDFFHLLMTLNIIVPFAYLMYETSWDPNFQGIGTLICFQWLMKLLCFISFPREVTEIH